MRAAIRVRIDSDCKADGKDGAMSEAVPDRLGGGRAAIQLAKMGKEERKKNQGE